MLTCVCVLGCNASMCGLVPVSLWECVISFERPLPTCLRMFLLICGYAVHFEMPNSDVFMCVLAPTLCFILFYLFHAKGVGNLCPSCGCFFSPCLPTSFISNTLTNSIHRASTCLVLAKIAFLLCRSKGLCCDKSDSLIEQLSGLLDYLSVIWLVTDLWTAEWLATFQSGWQTDWLSALFTGCKSDYLSICLESLIECVAGKVTGCPVISL